MTQNPRGPVPRRNHFAIGTLVQLEGEPETGTVVESDDFYDTLRIRGVGDAQVLVEWPRGGYPTRTWELPTNLVILKGQTAEIPQVQP